MLKHISMSRLNAILATLLIVAMPRPTTAQGYPFSQRSRIEQDIALTAVEVTYGRPVARGRVLFGKLVPWKAYSATYCCTIWAKHWKILCLLPLIAVLRSVAGWEPQWVGQEVLLIYLTRMLTHPNCLVSGERRRCGALPIPPPTYTMAGQQRWQTQFCYTVAKQLLPQLTTEN